MSSKHRKNPGMRRSIDILFFALVTVVCALTTMLAIQTVDKSRFDAGSEILGVNVAGLEAAEAAARVDEALNGLSVRLSNGDGELMGQTELRALLGEVDTSALAESSLQQQNSEGGKSFAPALLADGLEERLEAVLCGEGFLAEEPKNAEFVMDAEGIRIVPETRGNIPDMARCTEIVLDCLSGELDLDDESNIWEIRLDDPYVKAEITADDETLNAQIDRKSVV